MHVLTEGSRATWSTSTGECSPGCSTCLELIPGLPDTYIPLYMTMILIAMRYHSADEDSVDYAFPAEGLAMQLHGHRQAHSRL